MPGGDASAPVDVRRLRMPVTMTVLVIIACGGAILSVGAAWSAIASHSANRAIHADESLSLAKGGVAYSNDVSKAIATEGARTRRLIRGMAIECSKKGNEFNCKVSLPDNE